MRPRTTLFLLRLTALVGLGVSAAIYVDYLRPVSALCESGSGCDHVRASPFSHLLGVPVPLIGMAGFALLLGVSLLRHAKGRLPRLLVALGGAAAAIAFLAIQAFYVGAFCKLCVIVDLAAIAAAAFAVTARRVEVGPTDPAKTWIGAMVLWAVVPLAWARALPPPAAPPQITELWKPGVINVIEFADFECPFCRQLHPLLNEVLRAYDGKVHFTRLAMPLASHPHARDAARAYCCAEQLGKGDAMADALFSARDLSPAGCETIAASLGLALPAFRACVASALTEQRIDADIERFRAAKLRGLPTVFVGDTRILGLQSSERLREAFAECDRRSASWLLVCLASVATLFALLLAFDGFRRAGR
jgi:protein-disulfide isomerase